MIATGIAVACFAAFLLVQYRFAMQSAPRGGQWRLALFVVGAAMGASGLYLLILLDTHIRVSGADDLRTQTAALAAAAAIGGFASAWFIPVGIQKSIDMARRKARP